ncbi:hypothetical protein PIU50_003390 [Clostridioides difficile]|nr:hypothetical protein [Clostridioides difficile]MBZ0632410.1 hypothetical protein [Clostridioides difficile]MBZ0658268.1 hypothetical protein [Clostridioides difficile]HBF9262889.1 hypothetical protein [Clostridioides difficile]HBF9360012.1 hypothetical protein [Clostridioides difficile]
MKDKVLENIRTLRLTEGDKIAIANLFKTVTPQQKKDFEDALKTYSGSVYIPFKDGLYDKYVYALNAKLYGTGITMFDYLILPKELNISNEEIISYLVD